MGETIVFESGSLKNKEEEGEDKEEGEEEQCYINSVTEHQEQEPVTWM